jgi:hypothetical protein
MGTRDFGLIKHKIKWKRPQRGGLYPFVCVRAPPGLLEIHLQDVEPAREAVDRVDDLALVEICNACITILLLVRIYIEGLS